MYRQPSRSAANMDAIDCIVNTNDLEFENEILNQKQEQRRFDEKICFSFKKFFFSL